MDEDGYSSITATEMIRTAGLREKCQNVKKVKKYAQVVDNPTRVCYNFCKSTNVPTMIDYERTK